MTKNCRKEEGPDGYTYHISSETILKMAEEELLKRGVVQKPANHNLTTWHRDVVYCAMCDKNLDEGLRCNLEVVYKTIKEIVDRTPVVPEQKPAEHIEGLDAFVDWFEKQCKAYEIVLPHRGYDLYGLCKDIYNRLRAFKPAWADEDELNCNRIIRFLEPHKTFFPMKETKEEMQNWLKNRLKFICPQYHGDVTMTEAYKMGLEAGKASSWKPSELEKGALRTAIHILTEERNFPKATEQLQNILDAFEGKEPRKDWRPSEEQMLWLKCVVDATQGEAHEPLRSLYYNLLDRK